jgi:hypothetical protein
MFSLLRYTQKRIIGALLTYGYICLSLFELFELFQSDLYILVGAL